jgi:hypothetical protein
MVDSFIRYLHTPRWKRQHRWRKAVWDAMSSVGLTGLHGLPMNRRWIDIHRRQMPLPNLDPSLEGVRLVQISDLHYSPVVWKRYLMQMLEWVNALEPDLVVVTGDLITGGYRYAPRIAELLARIDAPFGVVCTFGNHDYSWYGKNRAVEGMRRADYLEQCLMDRGLIVLRNQVMHLAPDPAVRPRRAGNGHGNGNGHARPAGERAHPAPRPLVIVGLDDEWSGNIDPEQAFAGVRPGDPVICLNHNPANCVELLRYPWQWMLSGHTHGHG